MREIPGFNVVETLYRGLASVVLRARAEKDGRAVVINFQHRRALMEAERSRIRGEGGVGG